MSGSAPLCQDLVYGRVVGEHLPFRDAAIPDYGPPSRRNLPRDSVYGSPGFAGDQQRVALGHDLVAPNPVVRAQGKVAPPSLFQGTCALHSIAERIRKHNIFRHQRRQSVYVVVIDRGKPVLEGFNRSQSIPYWPYWGVNGDFAPYGNDVMSASTLRIWPLRILKASATSTLNGLLAEAGISRRPWPGTFTQVISPG